MDISFVTRKFQRSIASLSLLAVLTSLVSFTGAAFAEDFDDVSSSSPFAEYIDEASDAGFMTGYENGNFGEDDLLTRDQAATVLVRAFLTEDAVDEDYDHGFTDVSASNSLEDYINTAALFGIFEGYTDSDGDPTMEFGSGDYITRSAFAKAVVEASAVEMAPDFDVDFDDVVSGAWYETYVKTAYAWSIIDGYADNNNFGVADNVTRGQTAKMVMNGTDPVEREVEDPSTPDSDAALEVSVSND